MRHIRPYWVPLAIVAVVLTGVLLAMPWYFKTYRGASPDRGMSAEEIAWAAAYTPWRTRLSATLEEAYRLRASLDGELGRVLEEAAGCEGDLREGVGLPPTERLGPASDRAAAACSLAGAALGQYQADGEAPNWRTSQTLTAANGALDEADMQLRRLMLSQRPLPEAAGRHGESRVEPTLGRAVSAQHPPEVLCWSEDEWPQVRAELVAVGLERDPELRREANAYRGRVHVSPAVCGPLARLAHPDGEAAPGPGSVSEALLALLRASRHVAVVDVELEELCDAVGEARGAAERLGAGSATAGAVERAAREASGCGSG